MAEFTINSLSLISLMVLFVIAFVGVDQYLLFSLSSSMAGENPSAAMPQTQTSASVQVPSGDTGYGPTFSQEGYDQLIAYQNSITLTGEQQTRYQKLIMEIPHECCNGPVGQCECGHAVALRGLVKLLLQKGYTDQQIKDESYKWRQLFFSQNYPM
ncbi:hypothetical protein A3K63_01555 [Candidatus Micrarchaeota archaeon RBG_16_49_10]|nr:MAG: hypothetical protein A3K63_01555 [Candidatus Micrarchaeota archaeon RBG_16_49_10]